MDAKFKQMLSLAKAYFNTQKKEEYEYHQCLVLSTSQNQEKVYSFCSNSIKDLIEQYCSIFSQKEITTIKKIICMWENESVDVPPFRFIKKLCETDTANMKAEILLCSLNNVYITKTIFDIIG